MPIFFNLKRVRDFLMLHGEVYTMRRNPPKNLVTSAVTGSYYKQKCIATVQLEMIDEAADMGFLDLSKYVDKSGFKAIWAWARAAKNLHKTDKLVVLLVKVVKKYLPWKFAPWLLDHLEGKHSNIVYMGYNNTSFIMSSVDGEATSQISPHIKDTLYKDRIVDKNMIDVLNWDYDIVLIDKPEKKKGVKPKREDPKISDYLKDPEKTGELSNIED